MAIDAKVSFLGQIELKLADKLTTTDMSKCLGIIGDVLENFDMRECHGWGNESDTDDLLDSFVSSMNVQGRSQKTIDRYVYIIKQFMDFAGVPTRKINVYHIRNWIANGKQRGLMDSTLEGLRQILSSYFGWLHREGLIEKNPVANVGVIKVAKKQKQIYSEIDLEKLYQNCDNLRDKAIIHFLASTGCRVSEMTSLDRNTVNLNSLECVVHGKGNKERVVYLDQVTGMFLKEYLQTRKDDSEALFVGKNSSERIQPNGIRAMLKTLSKKAGVEHCHPHKFRRTLATELTRHGMPVQEVANLLGHDKLDTTMQYVMLNKDDIKSSYRRYA